MLLAALHALPSAAWAADAPEIPDRPSAPPPLSQVTPPDVFRCERNFSHKGKTYSCDSNVRLDGETLRPLFADIPAATSELNLYQRNRRNLRNAAYMGSLGLVVTVVGLIISRPPIRDGEIKPGGFIAFGGLGVTTASFSYALGLAWANETHLDNSIWAHNQARPQSPVALVSTRSFQQRYFKPHYITAVGVTTMLAGIAISHPPIDGGLQFNKGGYVLLAGALTTFVSVFYGLGALGSSTSASKPDLSVSVGDPLTGALSQVQFTTRLRF
jgi:hypothetical protein